MKIMVLPPDINQSKAGFTIEEEPSSLNHKAIRFGLSAVKNVGNAAIGAILEARENGGEFKSLSDFCQRVDSQKVNKKVLESLIKVGAMDLFGKRAAMLSGLENVRDKGASLQKQKANGQGSLFDQDPKSKTTFGDNLPKIEEFTREELLSLEKSLLGFYLSEHPLAPLLAKLERYRSHKISQLSEEDHKNFRVKIGGVVTDLRIVLTKSSGREMAFVRLEDDSGSMEVVVFPNVFNQTRACWVKDRIILAEGKVEYREEKLSVLIDKAKSLEELLKSDEVIKDSQPEADFEVRIPSKIAPRKLVELNKLLKQNQGKNKIALVFFDSFGREKRMVLPYGVSFTQDLKEKIEEIIKN